MYFTEDEGQRHVIAATDGLSSNVIGQVHVGFGEGVAGTDRGVSSPNEPRTLPPEWDHDFLSQTGATIRAFLGAGGAQAKVLGVLLVRQRKASFLTMPMKLC